MKRSKVPTPYMLIKANTSSKWDEVSFAIIHISDEWKVRMKERLVAISQFKADKVFCAHVYWEAPLGYYIGTMPGNLLEKILKRHEDHIFINLEFEEEKAFDKPINKLGAHQIFITRHGIAHYKAYGTHTRDQFATEEFNLIKLINE